MSLILSFVHSSISSPNMYLLSIYYAPGTAPGIRNLRLNKTQQKPVVQ